MEGLYGRRDFEIRRMKREDRPLREEEVRLKVLACGLCGTDLHFLRHREDFVPLGHEICAEVVEAGSRAGQALVGQRVAVEDVALCGDCDACKAGRVDLCRSGPTLEGQPGMSDGLIVHRRMVNPVGDLDPVSACLTEPLAVAIRCVEALDPAPGASLLVYGMGAIGLLCAAFARHRGAGRIAVAGRKRNSRRGRAAGEIALALGADELLFREDPGWEDAAARSGGFDGILVAAPPELCGEAVRLAGYGGRVLACGITLAEGAHAHIDVNDMVMNKKSLLTSIAEPALHFRRAARLIASGAVDARRLVTHTLPYSRAAELRELYGEDAPAVKTVLVPDPA